MKGGWSAGEDSFSLGSTGVGAPGDHALDMVHYDTQRLFVVEHGALVGVITQTDVVGPSPPGGSVP